MPRSIVVQKKLPKKMAHLPKSRCLLFFQRFSDFLPTEMPRSTFCSNEQFKKNWLFRVYRGLYYPVMWGLFHTPLKGSRSLLNNHTYNGKVRPGFLTVAQMGGKKTPTTCSHAPYYDHQPQLVPI